MSWIDPIYDRTKADITNRTSKAFFNVADWIRINGNAKIIETLINALYAVGVTLDTLAEPTTATIPTITEVNDFIANLEALREATHFPAATGIVELDTFTGGLAGNSPDYEDVNDWERNLAYLRTYLINKSRYKMGCGVPEAGQAFFWQVRFREHPYVQPSATPVRHARAGVAVCGTGLLRQNKFRRY